MRIIQSENPRPLNLLAVAPDGLVAAACDSLGVPGDTEVWETNGSLRFQHKTQGHRVEALAFIHDGRFLLLGENPILTVVDVTAQAKVLNPEFNYNWWRLAVSTDGSCLLGGLSPTHVGHVGCFVIDEGPTFRHIWSESRQSFAWFDAFAINHDGSRAALVERSESNSGRPKLQLAILEGETGKRIISSALDPSSSVLQLAFATAGSQLLARSEGRKVQIYDTATGAPAGELVHTGRPYVTGMAVHPRGPVACCRTNGTVCLWDVEKRELLRTF